ncbi:MAG: YqhA family protein [Verrucomicrobia bacterium]|nr:YqhA family protein [Verrucomicrobiota bacterium]MBV9674094.1 YqhA family protein [Verrucomicrobiota bacterium]
MRSLRYAFETVLWNTRLVVLMAVIISVLASLILFLIISFEAVRVLWEAVGYYDSNLTSAARENLLANVTSHLIGVFDGYLLGAFMLIFGFGLYELFLAPLVQARRILLVDSLDALKSRLGKVILIILIVEIFKDALKFTIRGPVDMLCVAGSIAFIGLALYLTHGAEGDKTAAPIEPEDVKGAEEPGDVSHPERVLPPER